MRVAASDLDLLVYDFDGVMTDNRVSVSESMVETVTCNRADGLGVNMIRALGVPQVIISTEANPVVAARAKKLRLEVLQDVADKRAALESYCRAKGYALERVMFVGNDVTDIEAMRIVGWPASPADAHPRVRAISRIVTRTVGGGGVVKELAEEVIMEQTPAVAATASVAGAAEIIRAEIVEGVRLREALLADGAIIARIETIANTIVASLAKGGKLFLAGNGGSYADAQHIAAEFVGRFMVERAPLAAIALGMNGSSITAIGNDYSYADVFVRELKALGRKGDVLIAISTSGNSGNLIEAIAAARALGIETFGLLGKGGGKIGALVPSIVIPSDHTARIQELHITVGHILCGLVDAIVLKE